MEDITVQELRNRESKGEKLNVLDVREQWEYEELNIGAKLIPLGELPTRHHEIADWKTVELIIHCQAGTRGNQAKKYLISQGFLHVRNLLGGITAYLETK